MSGEDSHLEAQYEDRFQSDTDLDSDQHFLDDEEEDELPDSYLDNVDGHWYVCRYDRTLPQIHAKDCRTCENEATGGCAEFAEDGSCIHSDHMAAVDALRHRS